MKYRTSEKGSAAHIIVICILVVGLLGALGFIFWQNFIQADQPTETTQTNQVVTEDESEQDEVVQEGSISGPLTYPSESIPDGLVIHAQNIDTNEEFSTNEHLSDSRFPSKGFELTVPEGRYYVYGTLASDPGYKAYYNKVIECGIRVECTDTTNIEVVVRSDEETQGVTVGDWWTR
jgi:hypothetical protein